MKILLKKSSDTNSFISDEADKAIIAMISNCQDSKILTVLMASNVNAKANTYRQKICKCFALVSINLVIFLVSQGPR
jgi:hypothetical protein